MTDHLAINPLLTPMFRPRFRRDMPRVPHRRPADDGEEPHDDRLAVRMERRQFSEKEKSLEIGGTK
jgi:hypothetical protein